MRTPSKPREKEEEFVQNLPRGCLQTHIPSVEEIICPLCQGILFHPTMCEKCNKLFCRSCRKKYKSIKNKSPCCASANFVLPSEETLSFLSKLLFKCPFKCSDDTFSYSLIISHIMVCPNQKLECPKCKKKYAPSKVKNFNEVVESKINKEILLDEIENVKEEIKHLKEKLKSASEKNGDSELQKKKEIELIDKCKHFFGNYKPIFACCNKPYPCYLCHNENENHKYEFSNMVVCLICNTIYSGKRCLSCNTSQMYKKKKSN